LVGLSLEWLPAGKPQISDVPGGGNPQPLYSLVATLGDEMGGIGVESVTPARRGAAQDPSSDPAPSRAGRGHEVDLDQSIP